MRKYIIFRHLLLLILVFGLQIPVAFSQMGSFELQGGLVHEGKGINGVKINVYVDSVITNTYTTLSDGKFSLRFKLNNEYLIEFNKFGFVPKFIELDTHVPGRSKRKNFISNLNDIVLIESFPGIDLSKYNTPDTRYVINPKTGALTDNNAKYSEVRRQDLFELKKEIALKRKAYNDIQKALANLSPEVRESLSKAYHLDVKLFEVEKLADNILASAYEKEKLAKRYADSIIDEAKKRTSDIYQESLKKKMNENNIEGTQLQDMISTLDKTASDFDIKSNEFFNRNDIQQKTDESRKIQNQDDVSSHDSLSLLENNLYLSTEMLKVAEYQLEIDRLSARTKEDSLEIQRREALLLAKHNEIKLTRKEIDNAKSKIAVQKLKIQNQTSMLFAAAIGIILLIILFSIVFINYKNKKKTNQLLIKINDELNSKNEEIQKINNELHHKNKQITDSIKYAGKIQEAILPSKELIQKQFPESFIIYGPKDIVSGDFYWYSHHDDFSYIAAVDCTGHSVPGAFMSMIGNTLLNEIINEKRETETNIILDKINKGILKALKQNDYDELMQEDGMDMTLCRIDHKNRELQISLANHKMFLKMNNELREITGDIYSIGGSFSHHESIKFTTHSIKMDKPCLLYLFSDGYADQFGGSRETKFYESRFKKLLEEHSHLPLKNQEQILLDKHINWKGDNKQTDDILIIGLRLDF